MIFLRSLIYLSGLNSPMILHIPYLCKWLNQIYMLVSRMKINTGFQSVPTTTNWFLGGQESESRMETDLSIENSTRIGTKEYYGLLSTKASKQEKKLRGFLNLPTNWDGNDAIPPDAEIVDVAIKFLRKMDEFDLPIDFSAPGPNGEILLEYRRLDLSAEIYFEPNGETEMITYRGDVQEYAGKVDIDILIEHFSMPENY